MSLRNQDYTDRELLHVVDDCADADGFAHTSDIADTIFGTTQASENGSRRYVGSRMAVMVRMGFCDRHPEAAGFYRLTQEGRQLMGGKLRKTIERALADMTDGERAMVLRMAAREVFDHGGASANYFRREYSHHENRWRDARRSAR